GTGRAEALHERDHAQHVPPVVRLRRVDRAEPVEQFPLPLQAVLRPPDEITDQRGRRGGRVLQRPPDLLERQPEGPQALHLEEPAHVLGGVLAVAADGAARRPHQPEGVVVAQHPGAHPRVPRHVTDQHAAPPGAGPRPPPPPRRTSRRRPPAPVRGRRCVSPPRPPRRTPPPGPAGAARSHRHAWPPPGRGPPRPSPARAGCRPRGPPGPGSGSAARPGRPARAAPRAPRSGAPAPPRPTAREPPPSATRCARPRRR